MLLNILQKYISLQVDEKIEIKNKVIPNRLACQAMEGCDGTAGGSPDELTLRRYDRFAKGGDL